MLMTVRSHWLQLSSWWSRTCEELQNTNMVISHVFLTTRLAFQRKGKSPQVEQDPRCRTARVQACRSRATSLQAAWFIAVSLLERDCWAALGERWGGHPQHGTLMGKFGLFFVSEPRGKLQGEPSNFRQKRGGGGEGRYENLEEAPMCWYNLSCSVS